MIEILKLALFPLIAIGAGVIYHRVPARVLPVVRSGLLIALAIAAAQLGTGVLLSKGSGVHTALGHAFVILLWLLTPAAIGVSVAEAVRARRWRHLVDAVVPFFILGAGLLAAISGYIAGPESSSQDRLRFAILHQVAFPVLVGLLLATWVRESSICASRRITTA